MNTFRFTDYRSNFRPHIYARGEDIALFDEVDIYKLDEDHIKARVQGTSLYEVEVNADEGSLKMDCTCPYADSGELCKHMAAVLIAADSMRGLVEDRVSVTMIRQPQEISEQNDLQGQLEVYVDGADNDELKEFLISALLDDDVLRRMFISRFAPESISVNDMIHEFDSICSYALGRDGFINYHGAGDFFNQLDSYLDDLETMVKNGLVCEGAEIIAEVTKGFDSIPLDDSDGGSTCFYEHVMAVVRRILDEEVEEANQILYRWMDEVIGDPDSWYLEEFVYPVWSEQFSSKELLDMGIQKLEKSIEGVNVVDFGLNMPYDLCRDVMELVRLKSERGDSEEEISRLLEPYKNNYNVIRYHCDQADKRDDLLEEERLLKRGFELYSRTGFRGVSHDFEVSLCRFYQRTNRQEEYKKILKTLLLKEYRDLKFYLEYKGLFEDEAWITERDTLIDSFVRSNRIHILPKIYVEETLLEDLKTWLEANLSLINLDEYSRYIEDEVSVLSWYLAALDSLASHSGNKKHYSQIVGRMSAIRRLPGGKPAIAKKYREYRVQYKRRKNFLLALDKVEKKWGL